MRPAILLTTLLLGVALAAPPAAAETTRHRARRPHRATILRLSATAYCDRGPTKSGVHAKRGIVAADPRQLPLGTMLRIVAPGEPHDGVYVVTDTGQEIKGGELDIFMPSCARAKQFGRKRVTVRVLKVGSGPADARATAPK